MSDRLVTRRCGTASNRPQVRPTAGAQGHARTAGGRGRVRLLALAALFSCASALAEAPRAPDVDLAALPPVVSDGNPGNPYRNDPGAVLAVGESAYAQACARCHGQDATAPGPAADLRLVGRYCNRVAEGALRNRCRDDADAYFSKTVRDGKVRLGIRHMPAFEDVIPPDLTWAIQSFIESRRK